MSSATIHNHRRLRRTACTERSEVFIVLIYIERLGRRLPRHLAQQSGKVALLHFINSIQDFILTFCS